MSRASGSQRALAKEVDWNSSVIGSESVNTIDKLKNAIEGSDAIVCGCGASLNALPLPLPDRVVSIGVNDVGRKFDPDYLVVVNHRSQFRGDRFRYVEQSKARYLVTHLELGTPHPNVIKFSLGQRGGVEFSQSNILHYTRNSPYVALCLAAHLGAKRIGLIGVDFGEDHFYGNTGRHALSNALPKINQEYQRLGGACRSMGIEIVNLSQESRLTAFPRVTVSDFLLGNDSVDMNLLRAETGAGGGGKTNRSRVSIPHEIAIPESKRASGNIKKLLDTLSHTVSGLGCRVIRCPNVRSAPRDSLAVVWNGRNHRPRFATLFCEHGWLPRSDYQISHRGINADSHIANFVWDGNALCESKQLELDRRLDQIRNDRVPNVRPEWVCSGNPCRLSAEPFLLAPFQLESDTNIVRHVPAELRSMQGFVDKISASNPPFPIFFKRHPSEKRSRNRRCVTRRRQDRILDYDVATSHQILKSGLCAGVITLNSNVAHDALLWDVPVVVLGNNIWPKTGDKPFATCMPERWGDLDKQIRDQDYIAARRAYAWFLISHQWTLADVEDPEKVRELLATAINASNGRREVARRVQKVEKRLRINFGCGDQRLSEYVNVDTRGTPAVDKVCGYTDENAFAPESVSEIYCRHGLQRLSPEEAEQTLRIWKGFLCPGGQLRLVVPDLEFHAKQLIGQCRSRFRDQEAHALNSIYGWRDSRRGGAEGDFHRWGYTEASLRHLLLRCEYRSIARARSGKDTEPWHLNISAYR